MSIANLSRNILLFIQLSALLVCSGSAFAEPAAPPTKAAVAKKVAPAVVFIKGKGPAGVGYGTGFLVSSDGKIVTALHVISDFDEVSVSLPNGDSYDSITILAYDLKKDLAVIKVPGFDLPTVDLGNSNYIAQGDSVLLVGNPEGFKGSLSSGIISGIRDAVDGNEFRLIQTDAAVNPGNSGGPLLNSVGLAIGVVTSRWKGAENLNFAVPINYARGMLQGVTTPITLKALRVTLGASVAPPPGERTTTRSAEPRPVAPDKVVKTLSIEHMKAIVRSTNIPILDEQTEGGFRIMIQNLRSKIVVYEKYFMVSMVLSDTLSLERINNFNENHQYAFVFKRASDNATVLEMDLYCAAGVTEATIKEYIIYFKTLVDDLIKEINKGSK